MEQRVCVLLAPGYEEVEALTPVEYLRRAGATVDIISTTSEITVPSAHQVLVQADSFLDDIRPEDYAMVVVPGGLPGVPNLIANEKVLAFVKAMADQGAWVTSLCAGPSVLDHAGVLVGKCTTCFPGWEGKLENIGSFSEDTVVIDSKVITSRGAGAAGYFALALVEALFDADKADEVKRAVVMDIVEKNLGL